MLVAGFAAFFTGVTEPLEFSFMFVAWPLYVLHAVFTGISLAFARLCIGQLALPLVQVL